MQSSQMDAPLFDAQQGDPNMLLSSSLLGGPPMALPMGYMMPPVPTVPPLFGAGEFSSMPFFVGAPLSAQQAFIMDPSSSSPMLLQELQELDRRINVERNITQQIMNGLQQCDAASLQSLKMRLTTSASTLDALLQQKRVVQARLSTMMPVPDLSDTIDEDEAAQQANMNNNSRLLVLSRRLSSALTFGPAIEELNAWCSDVRAFHPRTSSCLRDCLAVVRAHCSFDRELAGKLFATCHSYISSATPEVINEVNLWYNPPRRPEPRSNGSISYTPYHPPSSSAAAIAPHLVGAMAATPGNTQGAAANSMITQPADAVAASFLYVRIGEPLIKPFQLRHGIKTHSLSFSLPQDFEDLFRARTDVSLALRCFHAQDKSGRCAWPPTFSIFINGFRMQPEPCTPVDLRFASHTGLNVVELETRHCSCAYLYELCFQQRLPLGATERAAMRKTVPMATTKQQYREMVQKNQRPIVASLDCPISKLRMTVPVRGPRCAHVQCFDLRAYLLLNAHLSSWKCPICRDSISYAEVVVDGSQEEALAAAKQKRGAVSIEVDESGAWAFVNKGDAASSTAPAPSSLPSSTPSLAPLSSSFSVPPPPASVLSAITTTTTSTTTPITSSSLAASMPPPSAPSSVSMSAVPATSITVSQPSPAAILPACLVSTSDVDPAGGDGGGAGLGGDTREKGDGKE